LSKRAAARGFTVIELVVALAIFGLAAAALVRLFATELDRSGQSERLRAATGLAQSKLDAVILSGPPTAQTSAGEAPGGLRWRLTIAPYRDAALSDTLPVALARVTVTVGWRDPPAVTLSSLRLAPRP